MQRITNIARRLAALEAARAEELKMQNDMHPIFRITLPSGKVITADYDNTLKYIRDDANDFVDIDTDNERYIEFAKLWVALYSKSFRQREIKE